MRRARNAGRVSALCALACALICAGVPAAHARQQQQQQPAVPAPQEPAPLAAPQQDEEEEVLRVESELVQTAVTVLDNAGRFVPGLRREQFRMSIDGKPQPITFFEQVTAGTSAERRHHAAATGAPAPPPEPASVLDGGRTVFLFVDDLHLSGPGLAQARKSLRRYIDSVMGQNDRAAVISASGQVGFLQQLTDDKEVLRAAAERLLYRPRAAFSSERPPISEYQAIAVEERDDRQILDYLARETAKAIPGLTRDMAEKLVRSRTAVIAREAAFANRTTLSSLERLLRSCALLPGRETVVFFSEGFNLQLQRTDEADQMRRITDAAARADAVVHTVDLNGLLPDPLHDASRGGGSADPRAYVAAHSTANLRAMQEPLRHIADETGGRAVYNRNDWDVGMARALDESAHYYLLAWRPEREENRGGKFRRIEVKVEGRSDLTVRLSKGYFAPGGPEAAKKEAPKGKTPPTPREQLRAALAAVIPPRQLPVALAVSYVEVTDRGAVLTASAGVPSYPLTFKPTAGGAQAVAVDMACAVYDDRGKLAASAEQRLDLTAPAAADTGSQQQLVAYNFQFERLAPGLYQVRVVARDAASGSVGGASQWVGIPDLKKRKLALSSLLVGTVPQAGAGAQAGAATGAAAGGAGLDFDVARRFSRTSRMGFYAFVYNATAGAGGASDVTARVQVWRGDRAFVDSGEQKLATAAGADPSRLPYGADIDLSKFPAGRYLLQLTVTDRQTKQTASRFIRFEVR
ncbi:MAG TPA: VWA domain-containing protein [Pyrinomonadaceae bacterium]